jgi:hypothetical protein
VPMGYELHRGGRKTTQIDSIYQVGRLPSR